jgi:ATP-dependent Clp protease adaptor protein ClpS
MLQTPNRRDRSRSVRMLALQRGFVLCGFMQAGTQRHGRTAMAADRRRRDEDDDTGTGVVTKTAPKTKKPSLYKVLMLNDDYTPMEFVVHCLQRFFKMTIEDATQVMLHVHQKGVGVCGIFTFEVAETKVTQVMDFAKQHQHPLQCTMEKD